ncbi:acyl carrier protein [Pseudoroseicyclus aestuarii]|uniref:Acyl carrier protein n=2 Tax=Pseudoroseicyclus aestuarii TaxID=1795041 RepID=A0A318T6G6_9RHOB|nr:acyl carrier protein [Pseudoroseicyclus aestuarii]
MQMDKTLDADASMLPSAHRDIGARVTAILAEQAMLEPSDVEPQHSLAEIGIDSLGLVESIFAIEEAFDIQVPFNANDPAASAEAFDISTVATITAAVESLVRQQHA